MDSDYHHPLLYHNSSITLFESYIAIEKFIIDTRLSFIDQFKLFDLLKKLLPNDDNQLTSQGFLSWLVWRVDHHQEQQQAQTTRAKNSSDPRIIPENGCAAKKFKTIYGSHTAVTHDDERLVQFTQRQLEHCMHEPSDMQQQIDRLQSVVLRLASHVDNLNHQSDISNHSPEPIEPNIKHERIEDNEPSELDADEDHDDEASDVNPRLDFPASTSTNITFPMNPMTTKTIMYKGRNMMKHLRPRTTLTSFARHVASDLFTREEIMAKLHVDHNNERDVFLRHCICTAWNLTEQELYLMWPKIRNALLQLRRDAIAGKCIRINKRKQQEHEANPSQYNSDSEDDES